MISIMIQITTYIFLAILLGFIFGWLIAKVLLKKKYQKRLDAVISVKEVDADEVNKLKENILELQRENKLLKAKNKEISLSYGGQKYVLDAHNSELDAFQKRLLTKDEVIDTLTKKLSLTEAEYREKVKKYEEEVEAFMFERIETTKKYQDIREKYKALQKAKGGLSHNSSWITKWFLLPSKIC